MIAVAAITLLSLLGWLGWQGLRWLRRTSKREMLVFYCNPKGLGKLNTAEKELSGIGEQLWGEWNVCGAGQADAKGEPQAAEDEVEEPMMAGTELGAMLED